MLRQFFFPSFIPPLFYAFYALDPALMAFHDIYGIPRFFVPFPRSTEYADP